MSEKQQHLADRLAASGDRIFIRDAAEIFNRKMDTLRKWDRNELPKHLKSHREESGRRWRYWTPDQIRGIFDWIEKTDRRPGKGLPHWNPTQEDIDKLIQKLRKPRKAKKPSGQESKVGTD